MVADNQRFCKHQRLTRASDFRSVFEHGHRYNSSSFTLIAMATTREDCRLGLVVSRKCAKQAVRRNRIKRLIRESFRRLSLQPGHDIVVIGRAAAATRTNSQLTEELTTLWQRIS